MWIYELTHNAKSPSPGVAIKMHVSVQWFETEDDARLAAAAKHGLEVPNAWLDPVATSAKRLAWAWNAPRGVLIVQKA